MWLGRRAVRLGGAKDRLWMIDRVRDWAGWRAQVQLRPDASRVVGARMRAAGGLKREARRDRHRTLWSLDAGADAVVGADRGAPSPSWNVAAPEGHQRRLVSAEWSAKRGTRDTFASKRINGVRIYQGPVRHRRTCPPRNSSVNGSRIVRTGIQYIYY